MYPTASAPRHSTPPRVGLCHNEGPFTTYTFPRLAHLILKHPKDTIPLRLDSSLDVQGGLYARMVGNLEFVTRLCSALYWLDRPLKRMSAGLFSSEELEDVEGGMLVQEYMIASIRAVVEEIDVLSPEM